MRSGVTALELLIATALLALGLVPFLSLQHETTRQAGFTQGHALAVAEAAALMDRAASLGWRQLAAGGAAAVSHVHLPSPGGFAVQSSRVAFAEVGPGLGQLTVELIWRKEPKDLDRTVRTGRLLARPEASWLAAPAPPGPATLPGE